MYNRRTSLTLFVLRWAPTSPKSPRCPPGTPPPLPTFEMYLLQWFGSFVAPLVVLLMTIQPACGEAKPDSGSPSDKTLRAQGAKIFSASCVQCHGGEGQGTQKYYPEALIGDSSIGELAALISDTMPEEDPDTCVSKEARAVAMFIHHEFYSEAAQLRRRPPRQALSRLTAEQLRQSLADLYGCYDHAASPDEGKGLSGIYTSNPRWKKKGGRVERIDPVIDFDFAREEPAEGIKPEEYFIFWTGALNIKATGRYEFIVRSSCSFTMDFGHNDRMLIDNHVQSEGKEEFRETVFLTGGRAYPIEIEFQQRKRKTGQPPANISVSWIPPWGPEEIIPAEFWSPNRQPPTISLQAKFAT